MRYECQWCHTHTHTFTEHALHLTTCHRRPAATTSVACPTCGAPEGVSCRITTGPRYNQPCYTRIALAERTH